MVFRLLLQSKMNTTQAIATIRQEADSPEARPWSNSSSDPSVGSSSRVGLIAGNGRFRFLCWKRLEVRHRRGRGRDKGGSVPEIEKEAATVHWLSLGQLGKLIKTFKAEGIDRAVMAGQVRHKQIFRGIIPDLTMVKMLAGLAKKSTDSLIGGVARVLEDEGSS